MRFIFIIILLFFTSVPTQGFNADDVYYYVYEISPWDGHYFNFTISEIYIDNYDNIWKNGTFGLKPISRTNKMYSGYHPWDLFDLYLDGVEFEYVSDDDIYYSMIQPVLFHNETGSHYWIKLVEERSSCKVEYDTLFLENIGEPHNYSIVIANVDCTYNGFDDVFKYTLAIGTGIVLNASWEVEDDNFKMEFKAYLSAYDHHTIFWNNNSLIEHEYGVVENTGTEELHFKVDFSSYFILALVVIPIWRKLK